ncbi:alpha/beta fold hydrolase [Streptomyces malaysiensis]|uniref:alpha/beta fold hydrolase n=1 Tax=Streptomyces malaysiensis TaxID=92644 RepID=UPI003721605C
MRAPARGANRRTPRGRALRDLGMYAQWCEELMDRLEMERPFVVGCSIGGAITLQLAVRRGERLAGAVAMAAHGGTDSTMLTVRGLERELVDSAAPSRSDRTYLGTLAVVGRRVPSERAELIARMHRREDPEISNSDLIGWATHDVLAKLDGVACPTHLVVGDDDLWLDPREVRRAADLIPDSRYTLLEGIGHYPMEELEGFADTLHGWLSDLDGSRGRSAA